MLHRAAQLLGRVAQTLYWDGGAYQEQTLTLVYYTSKKFYNVAPRWKGCPGTNALAYFGLFVTDEEEKEFYNPGTRLELIQLEKDLWGQCYKKFYGHKLRLSYYARTFVPGKPFQPSLMFVGKARTLP